LKQKFPESVEIQRSTVEETGEVSVQTSLKLIGYYLAKLPCFPTSTQTLATFQFLIHFQLNSLVKT
jgi:hypothetical protein